MRPDIRLTPVRLALGLMLGAVPPLAGQWKAPATDSLTRILADRIARGGAVGIVVGVVEGGMPRVAAAGRTAGEGSSPVGPRTVFEIGSVSKVFTTTVLAEMVARGEVALDDPIRRYLPEAVQVPSRNGWEITLLHLATSTSGLPRIPPGFAPGDPGNPYADYEAEHLHAFLSGYTLPRDPGASYEYSNLGMGLLGHLLARRAGMSYEQLVTERILAPLGMLDTRLELTPSTRARLATGHGSDLEPVANWDFAVLAGAGGWRSTAEDMLRFLAAAAAPPPGPLGEALRMGMAPRFPTGNPGLQIGLGWHVLERGDRQIVWHNGQTGGYHAFLGLDPVSGANALVLANSATDIDDVGLHLIQPAIPLRTIPPPRPTVAVDTLTLERYVGRYELAPGFVLDITRQRDVLFVQATDQQRFRLYAASPIRFFLRVLEAEVGFVLDDTGAVTGVVLYQGGREMPGRRIP